MRKRVTYRPSRGQSVFVAAVGVVFILIGIFSVIPTFGAFGILWTLIAVGITGMNAYQAFGKGYAGPEIHIEEEETPPAGGQPSASGSAEERLRELRSLYDQRLITQEEYEAKRQEILREL